MISQIQSNLYKKKQKKKKTGKKKMAWTIIRSNRFYEKTDSLTYLSLFSIDWDTWDSGFFGYWKSIGWSAVISLRALRGLASVLNLYPGWKLLHSSPRASECNNGMRAQYFTLDRESCQGSRNSQTWLQTHTFFIFGRSIIGYFWPTLFHPSENWNLRSGLELFQVINWTFP